MEYNTYDDLVTALARTNDDIEKTQGASKRTHLIDEKRAIVSAMETYPLADDDLFRCEARCWGAAAHAGRPESRPAGNHRPPG